MKTKSILSVALAVIFILIFDSCKQKYQFSLVKDFRSNFSQIAFSSDGKYYARGYFNLKIFKSIDDSVPVKTITDFTDLITDIAFSPNSKYLSVATDSFVNIYSVDNDFQLMKKLKGNLFSFSSDGNKIAVADSQKITIYAIDQEFKEIKNFEAENPVVNIKYSKQGNYFVHIDKHNVFVYSLPGFEQIKQLKFSQKTIKDVAVSPDENTLAIAFNEEVYFYSLSKDKINLKRLIAKSFNQNIKKIQYSPDGKNFFVMGQGLDIYNINKDGKYIFQNFLNNSLTDFAFINDKQFAVSNGNGISFYNLDFEENAPSKFKYYSHLSQSISYDFDYDFEEEEEDYEEEQSAPPNTFTLNDMVYNRNNKKLFVPIDNDLNVYSYYYSRFNYNYTFENVVGFAYFHKKNYLAILNYSTKNLEIYKLGYTSKLVKSIPYEDNLDYFENSPLLISSDDNYLFLLLKDKRLVYDVSDPSNPVLVHTYNSSSNIEISPKDNLILLGRKIFKPDNFDSVCYYLDSLKSFYLTFSPDGNYLIGTHNDIIRIWSVADSFSVVKTFKDYKTFIFTEDGQYFIPYSFEATGKSFAIYKTNNFDEPYKELKFDSEIEDIFTSGRYLAVQLKTELYDSLNFVLLNIRRNFKVEQFIAGYYYSVIGKFINAGYEKSLLVVMYFGDCGYEEYNLNVFYKVKDWKPYKEISQKNNAELYFTNSADYILKFDKEADGFHYLGMHLLRTKDLKEVKKVEFPEPVNSVDFSPKKNYLILKTKSNKIEIYSNDKNLNKIKEFFDNHHVVFSNDEQYLAERNKSNEIAIYKVKDMKLLKRLYPSSSWFGFGFSPENKYFVLNASPLQLYPVDKKFSEYLELKNINDFQFYKNDQYLVAMENNYLLELFKLGKEAKYLYSYSIPDAYFRKLYLIDNKQLAVVQFREKLSVFDIKDKFAKVFQVPEYKYFDIYFDNKKNYLCTVSSDSGTVEIYSVKNNFDIVKKINNDKIADNILFTADNKLCFVFKDKLEILSVDDKFKTMKTINKHSHIENIVFSPDGKYFVMQTYQGPVLFRIK